MANKQAKEKNIRKINEQTKRNRIVKSKVKTAIKKAKIAAVNKDANVAELVSIAHKEINRSVSKGVYKKNNGANKISRLDKFVNKNK